MNVRLITATYKQTCVIHVITEVKRHNFHFVLFGVLLAVMSGKMLIAEIYPFLVQHHGCLCILLDINEAHWISDVQLRRLLLYEK